MSLTIVDLQACADATAEYLRKITTHPKVVRVPPVRITTAQQGFARSTYLTVPSWALARTEDYAIYYVVHEVTHYFAGPGHGLAFKHLEQNALAQWDLFPVYNRVYPKLLKNGAGDVLYRRH